MNADAFRDYGDSARSGVREFYAANHRLQTVEFVREAHARFLPPRQREMGVWHAMELLNDLVDDSDPDTELPQISHAIQTAEAIRADGHPEWLVLAGLIHDMGKVLCLWDVPQWAVTGDTFPVGCAWSSKIVFHELFTDNPDGQDARYQSKYGIYSPNCGLDNVLMSWGHDEYLYHVTAANLPVPAQYIIRYHSFYAAHTHGEYDWLMNDTDRANFEWVRTFNRYDLYTKGDEPPDVAALAPYYQELVSKFFPTELWW